MYVPSSYANINLFVCFLIRRISKNNRKRREAEGEINLCGV